jgi:hypothetical protein
VLALLYLPFAGAQSEAAGLAAFLDFWEFNSFAFALAKQVMPFAAARTVCLGAAGLGVLWVAWRGYRTRSVPSYPAAFALFFLLAPVVNPWYLLLWLPFSAMQPSLWSAAGFVSVLLSYATGANLGLQDVEGFNHPWWVRPLEILPVLLLWLWPNAKRQSS